MEVIQVDRGLSEVDMSCIPNPAAVTSLNLSENALKCVKKKSCKLVTLSPHLGRPKLALCLLPFALVRCFHFIVFGKLQVWASKIPFISCSTIAPLICRAGGQFKLVSNGIARGALCVLLPLLCCLVGEQRAPAKVPSYKTNKKGEQL
jgi:hypothetical protein